MLPSMLRDLLFHEHEYQYTCSEIIHYIEEYKLKFLGFVFSGLISKKYKKMYVNDLSMINLKYWKAFEGKLENTYSMHHIWLQKH